MLKKAVGLVLSGVMALNVNMFDCFANGHVSLNPKYSNTKENIMDECKEFEDGGYGRYYTLSKNGFVYLIDEDEECVGYIGSDLSGYFEESLGRPELYIPYNGYITYKWVDYDDEDGYIYAITYELNYGYDESTKEEYVYNWDEPITFSYKKDSNYSYTYSDEYKNKYPEVVKLIDNPVESTRKIAHPNENGDTEDVYIINSQKADIPEDSFWYIKYLSEDTNKDGKKDEYMAIFLTEEEFTEAVDKATYYKAQTAEIGDYSILENGYDLVPSNEHFAPISQGEEDVTEQTTEKVTETTTENTTEAVQNVYTKSDVDLSFDTSRLVEVKDDSTAVSLLQSVVGSMSDEEKASANAKNQLSYLAEEAAARAATVNVESDIVINNDVVSQYVGDVNKSKNDIESIINGKNLGVKKTRTKVRVVTSKNDKVSVSKENINGDVDVVEAVTPFASLEFQPSDVSKLDVESVDTNKIKVDFSSQNTTNTVTVKFNGISSDNFKAVEDENGNVLVTKYNPITDELSAKISESGVFTVVTNEKDFDDIKNLDANVQFAIKELASKGVIKGTSETEFSPESPITRAEVAALIVRILGVDDPNADGGFADVTRENWYFGTAGSSKQNNIIAGYEDNTFRGKVVIPKVQITSVTARVLKNELNYNDVPLSELNKFTDKDSIADWAKSDVALAANANMIIRRTDDSFAGESEMTRGDAAVVVKQLFDKVW